MVDGFVSLPPVGQAFAATCVTWLRTALGAGLAVNYGCSNGNCGLCKAKIVAGQVKKTRHHDYVLSESERAQGYVLLCSNTAVTDVEVEAAVAGGVQDIPYQEIAAKVKPAGGPDLIVWGSSTLTPLLIAAGLADEVVLLVFPVMIGRGKRIFSDGVDPTELKLVSNKATPSGVVISTYKPAGAMRTGSF